MDLGGKDASLPRTLEAHGAPDSSVSVRHGIDGGNTSASARQRSTVLGNFRLSQEGGDDRLELWTVGARPSGVSPVVREDGGHEQTDPKYLNVPVPALRSR